MSESVDKFVVGELLFDLCMFCGCLDKSLWNCVLRKCLFSVACKKI